MTHSGNCPEFLSRRPPAKLANLATILLFLRIKKSLFLFMAVALELHCHEGLEIISACLYMWLLYQLLTSESPRGTDAEKYIFSPVPFQTHGICVKYVLQNSPGWSWIIFKPISGTGREQMCLTALWNSNSSQCAKRGDPGNLSFSFWQRQILPPLVARL